MAAAVKIIIEGFRRPERWHSDEAKTELICFEEKGMAKQ